MTASPSAPSRGASGRERPLAVAESTLAALLWASYYLFVLWATPDARPGAIIVWPFVFGGAAFAVWSLATGEGRTFAAIWCSPAAYVRTACLVAMQWAVLAATYLTGPVDSSLLSLIGDVVATPVLAVLVLPAATRSFGRPGFVAGLLLSLAGGTLAIVGGHPLAAVPAGGWLAVVAVPLAVAFYFLLTAKASSPGAMPAVVGQSMLAAGAVSVLLSPWVPGGGVGVVELGVRPLLLLAANGFASFFVAPLLYFRAIRRVGLGIPPLLMTGIPVFTLLLSALFLRLSVPVLGLIGIPVAIAGAVMALASERPAAPVSTPEATRPTG